MLFGHQNDDNNNDDNKPTDSGFIVGDNVTSTANPLAVDPTTGASLPVIPEELEHSSAPEEPVLDQPAPPAEPPTDDSTNDTALSTTPSPSDDVLDTPSSKGELLHLKQQALEQLSPLVGHLEQSPEEKFRTTMMMIQSSDNQALIKDAYTAAQAITDDKTRAQALLDIVNEINYFTQQAASN